jgi:centromere/kinetochore protein ZW10
MLTCSGTTIESVDRVLDGLDLLRPKIIGLKKDLDTAILMPRLQSRPNTSRIIVEGDSITTATEKSPLTITALLDDLENNLFTYLINTLPPCVVEPLSAIFIPGLVSRLIGGPLSSSVPPDLSGLMHFDSTLDRVRAFADALDKHGWPWSDELRRWADDSSNVWLARRSDGSLHSVRQLLLRGLGKPRSVERVETQTIAQENDVFEGHDKANDWNAGWSDDGEGGGVARTEPRSKSETTHGDDDEDTSAWGWDENDNEDAEQAADERDADSTNDVEDDAEDAWGAWDVDDDQKQDSPIMTKKPAVSPKKTHKRGQSKANGSVSRPPPPPQMEREVTLREAYFITALPEQMLEIIVQAVEDADTLSRSDHTANPVTPAATGLFKLPCLLLGMYRACAPTFYTHDVNGNMYLYNDCLYLAEQLRLFTEHYDSRNGASDLAHSGLYDEMSALETFGKGAYRKEMESQRTILGDLLDGTEEFKNCTEQPFADICDGAVSATIDRLRQVNAQFAEVLAPSALLQSTGSLLSTVTSKVIVNIEDMSDISEPESQRLALFCRRISALQDLFTPGQVVGEENDSQQAAVAAAVYVQQWWKFQYLAEVLESSLADIKYLWMEGELSLEFDTEEIVDLIEALFADSDHRRKAILDIRRSGRRG